MMASKENQRDITSSVATKVVTAQQSESTTNEHSTNKNKGNTWVAL